MALKFKGKGTKVTWQGTTPAVAVATISGESRTFTLNEEAGTIDATTRDSTAKEYLVDDSEITAELSGVDVVGGAPALALDVNDIGTLIYYPEGDAVGKRTGTMTATVTTRNIESAHDGLVDWTIGWRVTTAITWGTVSA